MNLRDNDDEMESDEDLKDDDIEENQHMSVNGEDGADEAEDDEDDEDGLVFITDEEQKEIIMNQDVTNRSADDMYFDNLKEAKEADYGDSRFSNISTDIETITNLFGNHQLLHKSAKTDTITEEDRIWADTFEIGLIG